MNNKQIPQKKSGLLLLNKPEGITSFDCIRVLKKAWNRKDLGHGGTLDSFATGLLPILLGDGLKLVRFFLESYPNLPTYWKTYEGIIQLGASTETGDLTGTEKCFSDVDSRALDLTFIQSKMNEFCPAYLQTPPSYSAKKIKGNRASDLARSGTPPKLDPTEVQVAQFSALEVDSQKKQIKFSAKASKGAYMRVLAQDLANNLGTIGHLIALKRTAIGNFSVENAYKLEEIERNPAGDYILSLDQATSFLPEFPINSAEADLIIKGKTNPVTTRLANSGLPAQVYCAKTSIPIALLELTREKQGIFLRAF